MCKEQKTNIRWRSKYVIVPLKMKILNVQAKVDHLKNAQNFEITGQQQKLPAKHSSVLLHYH